MTSVESVFEKTITVEEQEKAEAEKEAAEKLKSGENSDKNETEDSWAKLGDTISNFFGEKEESEEGLSRDYDSGSSGSGWDYGGGGYDYGSGGWSYGSTGSNPYSRAE